MNMETHRSIFSVLALPEGAVVALFLLGIGLVAAALVPGLHVGGVETPRLSRRERTILGWVGAAVILMTLVFLQPLVPVSPTGNEDAANSSDGPDATPIPTIAECRDPAYSVPLTEANLKATGRNQSVMNVFRVVSGTHSSTNCRERYTASWTASPGHLFFVEDGRAEGPYGVHVTFTGDRDAMAVSATPGHAAGLRFLTSLSVDVTATASQSLRSKPCGVRVELKARHLPEACEALLGAD
jgi:hypothetical protein